MFEHEQVVIRTGPRSGLPVIVALHSTALGPALGGCRLATYPHWTDGLTDALRLSAAMTVKCAVAGLPNGGGKTVVPLPAGPFDRRAVLLDVGDAIEALDGRYGTGPDVGTGPDDMLVIGTRTRHVACRPVAAGGSGDSSTHTAAGVLAALHALCGSLFGSTDLAGRRFAVVGLGRVGADVARRLSAAGAALVVSDVDPARAALAASLGADVVPPSSALYADVDVLVPAALGGVLTPATVPLLRCRAVAGPANNQLDTAATAALLHQRGIVWVPDHVVSAGGVTYAASVELHGEPPARAAGRVAAIGDTVLALLETAARTGGTPLAAADALAARRLRSATGRQRCGQGES
ncbi:Glu/Leu/Phe/Val dehydrogenase [Dactylosporangium aurantiacum]|uniref:Glu/Leu/Phe/Val dehydrogenase n=1 Tax=Dactylosporangium aurantiacum TaxID=35754 RepID=A0A9Q9I881_9ACTN|nr:Glu/Leu/Phe/Val dehydrogenase dimerization domain-containing protein [Dactylosporangium aurantiacum]MDG6105004.1 Glu/Leu/Phe/Val dehydrogenase dimerization domain-containing protein [Dactylosporangium aurantiacum]UWZ51539.1 Glu/Leu/Phe/Val dehydrogenase [Dactylosporangium aurantiacum]